MLVPFGFYALSAVAFLMVIALLRYADNSRRLINTWLLAGAVWLIFVTIMSRSGTLADFSLPPRVPLFIVIPAVIAGIIFTGRPSFRSALEKAPLYVPVFFTSFRIIVELLIYGAYRMGIFPERVTFEGLNFDMLVGLSAIPVGYLLLKGNLSRRGLLIWNIAALAVLSLTVYSFVSTYYFSDYTSTGSTDFVKFPYVLLAAVLLPVAVFLHVFSIRQTRSRLG
ncbi:MAG TPA: hypothetical protein VIL31_02310 [Cyclobacteriaceae bacterium]|jgi:hypothetical protein